MRQRREDDPAIRNELRKIIGGLTPTEAVVVIRAFSYFSHLANMAENEHHIRRTRAHALAGSPPKVGSLAHAFDQLEQSGLTADDITKLLGEVLISPVLTAHLTEVRRRSTMRREIQMADLLDRLDGGGWTGEQLAELHAKLRRAVLGLWQTNVLRQTRPHC